MPRPATTRERVLAVTERLVEKRGVGAVTLREVARAAGLSHAGPLRHFPSLAALLGAVAATGFRGLHDAVATAVSAAGSAATPLERLAAAGAAYVRYAVERPGVFTLMFRFDLLDMNDSDLQREAQAAWVQLLAHVNECRATGWHATVEREVLAAAHWSAVHGMARLWSQGALQRTTGQDDLEAQLHALLTVLGLPGTTSLRPRARRARKEARS